MMGRKNLTHFELSDEKKGVFKDECINPTHEYRILVPIDKEAAAKLYQGEIYTDGEISSDMVGLVFKEDTFYYMESKIFDFINVECNTLINMYEEEILDADKLDKAGAVVELIIRNSDDTQVLAFTGILLDLIRSAKKYGTIVGFYF